MTATVPSPPAQPATPGQALRVAADRLANARAMPEWRTPVDACVGLLRRWADELDAAPAAPDADALQAVLADLSPEAANVVRRVARERDSLARRCALRFEEAEQLRAERDMLARALAHPRRLVDATQLDAAPAVYTLPAEPPEGTQLWSRNGVRVTAFRSHGDDPHLWWDAEGLDIYRWHGVLDELGPLSSAPPAGTEAQ